ncbi:MAG: IS66 family transposase zinc-finger binding domain-containing protein [Verrucomicrobiales bacterium]
MMESRSFHSARTAATEWPGVPPRRDALGVGAVTGIQAVVTVDEWHAAFEPGFFIGAGRAQAGEAGGGEWKKLIGWDVTETLDLKLLAFIVVQTKRAKYACPACPNEMPSSRHAFRVADPPSAAPATDRRPPRLAPIRTGETLAH